MLGLDPGKWFVSEWKMAPYPADIRAGLYHQYCYSDMVLHQLVGDIFALLMCIIQVESTYIITRIFNNPDYLPLAKKYIKNIHIKLL